MGEEAVASFAIYHLAFDIRNLPAAEIRRNLPLGKLGAEISRLSTAPAPFGAGRGEGVNYSEGVSPNEYHEVA